MTKYSNGEYIPLIWDGGYGSPDAYYIKGHVSHEQGINTLIEEGAIENESEVGLANKMYGRWSMEATEDGNRHMLRTYNTIGRGRFKITEFGVGIFALKTEGC